MVLFEYILILLAAVLLSNLINRFLPSLSVPIIQMILGAAVALIPFGAFGFEFELEPELFFALFISLLVFHSAMKLDKKSFWAMKGPILNMALILVVFIVVALGWLLHFFMPEASYGMAFLLMAALAPTDIVAVDAVAKRVKMPEKIMGVLTGESLINDASGIVCFQFALAALVTGSFSLSSAVGQFVLMGAGGILLGLVLTGLKYAAVRKIRALGMENVTLHTLLEILTPFVVFIVAESFSVSGILAVFASGAAHSFMRDKFNPETVTLSLTSDSVWSVLSFTLDGLVFVILGTQLPGIFRGMHSPSFPLSGGQILLLVIAITAALLAVRFVWWLLTVPPRYYVEAEKPLSRVKSALIFSLAGPRGAVTLATAMTIPHLLGAEPFPYRELILILAVGVIVLTLLITNFILPLFVERSSEKIRNTDEALAYGEILRQVIAQLNRQATPENQGATNMVIRSYYARYGNLMRRHESLKVEDEQEKQLRLEMVQWEQENTLQLRDSGQLDALSAAKYLHMLEVRQEQIQGMADSKVVWMIKWLMRWFTQRLWGQKKMAVCGGIVCAISNNGQYVLMKLRELEGRQEDPVVVRLISEYEVSTMVRKRLFDKEHRPDNTEVPEDRIIEVAGNGLQMERDLVQEMFEAGRITWETARDMRRNIAAVASQFEEGV
ncbi:sodium:proton antiporter [Aminipila butyrica]|uniref:Sodium:proton antiporter n=1 Tax=Aminipila butyrica TaxID=433296 RepID=A0A858BU74_9FIRM|nr:sodium:proton antiporter [Aminipila butyrica]QIB68739.1 sodium:proton antiporter [Aminipila butyrica]